jgi:ParB-like chromosome segregation protein Spo0J
VRQEFDKEFIEELASSIRKEGVLVPIIVRQIGKNFEIIAGEQRWRAAKIAKLKEVPVSVLDVDDKKALELSLIDNVKRKDLQGWEREDAVWEMWKSGHYKSLDDLASVLDVKKAQLENILEARELRRKEGLPDGASTRMITAISSLDAPSRKRILMAQENGDLPRDIHKTTELVANLKKAAEEARPSLVDALASGRVDRASIEELAEAAGDDDEVEQLLEAKKTLSEKEFKSIVSYIKSEKGKGRKPILRTVIDGDIRIWNSYLTSVEAARDELIILKPSKCGGWPIVERQKLKGALLTIENHTQKMLDALEGTKYER